MTPARARARPAAAVALLAIVTVAWAALPLGGGAAVPALAAALCCVAAEIPRLLMGERPAGGPPPSRPLARLLRGVARAYLVTPWGEAVTVAVLVLEALHHTPPWHTAVLGVALLAFLFAVHLAETDDGAAAPRAAAPVLAAGLGLLVLATGAAMLPALRAGHVSELLRVIAVAAAISVGALTLPTGAR